MASITIYCANEECQCEIELELSFTKGEMYGQDADGNRGVWRNGYAEVDQEIPPVCTECGHEYTTEEYEQMTKSADDKASRYEPSYDPPDHDDDDDDRRYH